jgi:hypothetical protein
MRGNKRNNYKRKYTERMMAKKGQIAIFVIIGLVIVFLAVILYFFYPDIRGLFGGDISPEQYLRSCVEEDIQSSVDLLAKQGGYANPEGYILYKGERIKYLCYTAGYYKTCIVQQPMIKGHFEEELGEMIKTKAATCVQELEVNLERRGYTVSRTGGISSDVEIIPGTIRIKINSPMSITKESTQVFSEFNVNIPSEMYTLLMLATSIIDYESTYGEAETSLYVDYYPNIRIEKMKLGDGSTIYSVEDVRIDEKFTFASRSLAWPPGYGTDA